MVCLCFVLLWCGVVWCDVVWCVVGAWFTLLLLRTLCPGGMPSYLLCNPTVLLKYERRNHRVGKTLTRAVGDDPNHAPAVARRADNAADVRAMTCNILVPLCINSGKEIWQEQIAGENVG